MNIVKTAILIGGAILSVAEIVVGVVDKVAAK